MRHTSIWVSVITISLLISCTDFMSSDSYMHSEQSVITIDYSNPSPTAAILDGVVQHLAREASWLESVPINNLESGDFVLIEDLKFDSAPSILLLKDDLTSNYPSIQLVGPFAYSKSGNIYDLALEKYKPVAGKVYTVPAAQQLPAVGIMVDTDMHNDDGQGLIYLYATRSAPATIMDVALSHRAVEGDLFILTARQRPELLPQQKVASASGDYLYLTRIKMLIDKDSGSYEEVSIFIGGNESSFYFNRVTNHKFNGAAHYDAAGDIRTYPDINSAGVWYTPAVPIALCRLSDDYELRLIAVESDDGDDGVFGHDNDETGTPDNYARFTNIGGKEADNSSTYTNQTRWFRLGKNNPSNNDDTYYEGEISNITISTVSTTEYYIYTDDVHYRVKRVHVN